MVGELVLRCVNIIFKVIHFHNTIKLTKFVNSKIENFSLGNTMRLINLVNRKIEEKNTFIFLAGETIYL